MKPETVPTVPLFGPVSRRASKQIAAWADELEVPSGEVLTRQGDYAREFFVVLEGTAEVTRNGELVAVLGPGEFFGEVGLVESVWRTATVIAATPMKLLVMAPREFRTMLQLLPEAAGRIEDAVSART